MTDPVDLDALRTAALHMRDGDLDLRAIALVDAAADEIEALRAALTELASSRLDTVYTSSATDREIELTARAEAAEAKVARVEAVVAELAIPEYVEALRAALDNEGDSDE